MKTLLLKTAALFVLLGASVSCQSEPAAPIDPANRTATATDTLKPRNNPFFPNFPPLVSARVIPHDIADTFETALCDATDVGCDTKKGKSLPNWDWPKCPDSARTVLTRLFDIFSWQSFIAVNLPVDETDAQVKNSLVDSAAPRWATWKELHEVFKEDGSEAAV